MTKKQAYEEAIDLNLKYYKKNRKLFPLIVKQIGDLYGIGRSKKRKT